MASIQKMCGCLATACFLLLLASCAKLEEDVPAPVAPAGVHDPSWTMPAAPESHGRYLKTRQWDDAECVRCHAADYSGGLSGVSCFTCHAPYPHSVRFANGGHPAYLALTLYPLTQCQSCHGSAYTGGSVVDASCSSTGCHVDRNGTAKSPEACNTCHGDFRAPTSESLSFAPPKSVAGDTLTSVPGVGAHARHLVAPTLGKNVRCSECHSVPSSVSSPGHIDGAPRAEVVFHDTLALLVTGNGTYAPTGVVYDPGTFRCANTYCHGNWRATKSSAPTDRQFVYTDTVMTGSNSSPVWTQLTLPSAACETCHSLPPIGHLPLPGCSGCHGEVVDADNKIIDQSKHINGRINVFGTERPF